MPRTAAPALTANARRPLTAAVALFWSLALFAAVMVIALAAEIRGMIPVVALAFALGGLVLAASAVVGLWTAALLLIQPDPALTVGPEGLWDRRLSPAPLPWDAIRWRRVTVSRKRKAADAVQFRLTAPYPIHPPARALALVNRMLGLPPYTVQAVGLDVGTDRIAAACALYRPSESS